MSRGSELVILLTSGLAQRQLYFREHPRLREVADRVVSELTALLDETGRPSLFLGVVEGHIVHEGRYLVGPTIAGRRLVALAERLGSGGVLLERDITRAEVLSFFDLAALDDVEGGLAGARALLAASGITHLQLSPPYEDPGWFGQFLFEGTDDAMGGGAGDDGDPTAGRLIPVCQSLFESVDEAHGKAAQSDAVDVDGARAVIEQLLGAADGNFVDVMQVVRYPDYDSYTVGHSVRVALILTLVCHRLGAEPHQLLEIGTAGLLHDVGKGRIPDEILYKPGRLDPDERQLMERHAVLGAQALLESRRASLLSVSAAWGHHVRPDGGGYPVPPEWAVRDRVTRILKVCDAFEAITAVRPYQEPVPARRALELIVGDRGGFDPSAVKAFVHAMGAYPPGTAVTLSSGARGVVTQAGERLDRPRVRLTHDPAGDPIDAPGAEIDLGDPAAEAFHVVEAPDAGRAA